MASDEVVEQVRESADIVQIIGEHVKLRRVGRGYRGPCPFHQGTHANFSVDPVKRIYHCFVCHETGDVFSFLMKRMGMDFPTALRSVADRVGVLIPETRHARQEPDPREPLWELNHTVAEYFRRLLWDQDEGRAARDYLTLRRVTREVADRFELGVAPADPTALQSHLNALGFTDERLLEAGLLFRREGSEQLRPRFRRRLIFPIQDASAHYVGFGGRLLGPGEPKYLNSAESPTFSKARLLYGMHMAKNSIRRDDRVLIVEGYFDVARLVSAGFETAVAPLGTALTEAQALLLKRYTRNAYLLYDSDRAGLKATFRAGDELLRHGFAVQVVTLPEGEDPDTFVDRFGGEKLAAQLEQSIDIFERRIQLLERAGWFADLKTKRRALDRLLPTIRATADVLTRDLYLTRVSEVSHVDKALLRREVGDEAPASAPAAASAPARSDTPASAERRGPARRRRSTRGDSSEQALVQIMLHHRSQLETIGEQIGREDFRSPVYREIFERLLDSDASASNDTLSAALSAAAAHAMQELLLEPEAVVDVARTIRDSVNKLRVRALETQLMEIDRLLPLAADAEKDTLIRRKESLLRDIRGLGGIGYRHFGKSALRESGSH